MSIKMNFFYLTVLLALLGLLGFCTYGTIVTGFDPIALATLGASLWALVGFLVFVAKLRAFIRTFVRRENIEVVLDKLRDDVRAAYRVEDQMSGEGLGAASNGLGRQTGPPAPYPEGRQVGEWSGLRGLGPRAHQRQGRVVPRGTDSRFALALD